MHLFSFFWQLVNSLILSLASHRSLREAYYNQSKSILSWRFSKEKGSF